MIGGPLSAVVAGCRGLRPVAGEGRGDERALELRLARLRMKKATHPDGSTRAEINEFVASRNRGVEMGDWSSVERCEDEYEPPDLPPQTRADVFLSLRFVVSATRECC